MWSHQVKVTRGVGWDRGCGLTSSGIRIAMGWDMRCGLTRSGLLGGVGWGRGCGLTRSELCESDASIKRPFLEEGRRGVESGGGGF